MRAVIYLRAIRKYHKTECGSLTRATGDRKTQCFKTPLLFDHFIIWWSQWGLVASTETVLGAFTPRYLNSQTAIKHMVSCLSCELGPLWVRLAPLHPGRVAHIYMWEVWGRCGYHAGVMRGCMWSAGGFRWGICVLIKARTPRFPSRTLCWNKTISVIHVNCQCC